MKGTEVVSENNKPPAFQRYMQSCFTFQTLGNNNDRERTEKNTIGQVLGTEMVRKAWEVTSAARNSRNSKKNIELIERLRSWNWLKY